MSFKFSFLIVLSSLVLFVESTCCKADTCIYPVDSCELEEMQSKLPIQEEPSIHSLDWIFKVRNSSDSTIITGGPNDFKNLSQIVSGKTVHFNQEEKAIVSLTFPGTNVFISDTLQLKKIKSFIKRHSFTMSPCESFEYQQPLWISPLDGNEVVKADIDRKAFVQGKASIFMEGRDETRDGFVCCLVRSLKDIFYQSFDDSPKSAPDKTWFFFYVYGEGNPNAHFNLLVTQSSEFKNNNRDVTNYYNYMFPLDFIGWKQVAIRYSDMKSTSATNISNGEVSGTKATDGRSSRKIVSVQYTLISSSPEEYVRMNLDNLLILSDD